MRRPGVQELQELQKETAYSVYKMASLFPFLRAKEFSAVQDPLEYAAFSRPKVLNS